MALEDVVTRILDSRLLQIYTAAFFRFVLGFHLRGKSRAEMTNTRDVERPVVWRRLNDTKGIRL